jgi:hypothetical protein
MNETNAKFSLGNLFITPAAQEAVSSEEVLKAISRHVKGDWGDVCPDDAKENEFSLGKDLRLFSVYHTTQGTKFWIITEADRSVTTVLLPSDY